MRKLFFLSAILTASAITVAFTCSTTPKPELKNTEENKFMEFLQKSKNQKTAAVSPNCERGLVCM